jgi:hypothetical protein
LGFPAPCERVGIVSCDWGIPPALSGLGNISMKFEKQGEDRIFAARIFATDIRKCEK